MTDRLAMDGDSSSRSAAEPKSVGRFSIDLRGSQGVLVGDGGSQRNIFNVDIPRSIRNTVLIFIIAALLGGGGWVVVTWVMPQFAPSYKTQFLIDTTGGTASDGPETIASSLRTVVGNSGDRDALALRSFGGECGAEDNTTQLVDFGTDNRQEITQVVGGVREGGKATLLRGIVEAVEDFSEPFAQRAKQVNRVIVVTRHGVDACDEDTAFVEKEIRNRIAAAGLAIEFRLIGYQVPDDQRDRLNQIATGAGAPEPMFVNTPSDLDAALGWFTNTEPVLRHAQQIVNILNPTVEKVNTAVKAITDGRLDVAERTLSQARSAITETDTEFEGLRSWAKTPKAQDIHGRASNLRTQQGHVVASATDLLDTARAGSPLGLKLTAFEQVATAYNNEVSRMNEALAALRAKVSAGQR
ncbi:MAG: VWA domain-containing protein [Actinomycetota bacterium]|nr:VWA domain-containing protein [Actinomycetota bacterium]